MAVVYFASRCVLRTKISTSSPIIPPTPQAHLSAMIGFGSNDKELVGKLRSQNLIAVVPNDYLLAQR
jgi:hypothetical protein